MPEEPERGRGGYGRNGIQRMCVWGLDRLPCEGFGRNRVMPTEPEKLGLVPHPLDNHSRGRWFGAKDSLWIAN